MGTKRRIIGALSEIRARLDAGDIDDLEARALAIELAHISRTITSARWKPYPWQIPPGHLETHGAWLMLGGRGTGKTEGCARYMDDHANGPPCDPRIPGGHRMAIIAPTLGDAADACFNGPSGLHMVNPATRLKGGMGGSHVWWPNKASARLFGCYTAEDVERLRAGGNRCLVWFEELAAQRLLKKALEHTALGLRIGTNPHYIMSTTPKPRAELRELVADPKVKITKGKTRDATNLDPSVRAALLAQYEGTRTGKQELDAEILDDVEGAYWKMKTIDATRFAHWNQADPWTSLTEQTALEFRLPLGLGLWTPSKEDLKRKWVTWVAVDPPGETAECGIIVGTAPRYGRAGRDHAVILADYSLAGPPEVWGPRVAQAWKDFAADGVVVEKNQGGDMTRSTIHNADPSINVEKISAEGSKGDRAEPVSMLYPKGWIHHHRTMPALEEQLTSWVPGNPSPDRLDALVHLVAKLLRPVMIGGTGKVENPLAA